jgi:pimeloyl-ACP methyl ester carboxylesterase
MLAMRRAKESPVSTSTRGLLIHGVLSDLLTEPIIARMRERKPDLKIVPVSDRGHAPLLDEQEAVDAIATFLESV